MLDIRTVSSFDRFASVNAHLWPLDSTINIFYAEVFSIVMVAKILIVYSC
jgi:hypothetical protein